MARIYHDEHNERGERALVWIVCDGCNKMAKPGDPEMLANWIKTGFHSGRAGDRNNLTDWIYCGTCKQERT
jgi:hypothetical protein